MSRYNPHQPNAYLTYKAAEYWRDHCLLRDGSVFSNENLWKESIFQSDFQQHFIENLDTGKGSFMEKLEGQFKESKPAAKKLLAETLWVLYLGDAFMTPKTKRKNIEKIWGWSGSEIPDSKFLHDDNYLEGLGNFGPGFNVGIWRELVAFILFMQEWKQLKPDEQKKLLKDSNGFSEKLDDWLKEFDSRSFATKAQIPNFVRRQIRHVLNHLLFPDNFERIFSGLPKRKIIKHYGKPDDPQWENNRLEYDGLLREIRSQQEEKYETKELDFYADPLRSQWDSQEEEETDKTTPDEGKIKEKTMIYTTSEALNRIFYGPPGTGKTYHTTNAAVEILDPDFYKENKADRPALRKRFEALKKAEQIDFVTFHQSFGYEDFVEGIRPVMEGDDNQVMEEDDSGGIAYEIQDGVFKHLCELAKSDKPSDSFDQAIEQFKKDCETDDLNEPEKTVTIETVRGKEFEIWYSGGKNFKSRSKPMTGKKIYSVRVNNLKKLYLDPETKVNRRARHRAVINYIKEKYKIEEANPSSASRRYVLIIDEINRGNIAKIFGELITLIEESRRLGNEEATEVTLPYSKERFGVPANLYIIGTMNTADRSIALLDTALRRRFEFVEMMPDEKLLTGIFVEGVDISQLFTTINKRIEALYDRDHQIGHTYFLGLRADPSLSKLADIFRHAVLPLLQEYFYDDWEKLNVVLNGNGFVTSNDPPKMLDAPFIDKEKKIWRIASEEEFNQADKYQIIYQGKAKEKPTENDGDE